MRALLSVWASMLAAALCSLTLLAAPAHADNDDDDEWARFMLALDLDYAYAIEEQSIAGGGGGALRIGSELDLLLITLIPEAYISHHSWSKGDSGITTGKLGGRVRIGKILEPGLYGHFGLASVSGGGGKAYSAPALDIGFTLDFTLLPLIDIGAHAAYNAVLESSDQDAIRYATLGLHAALVI